MPSRSAERGGKEWEGRFGLILWVITKELVASSSQLPSWAQRTSCGYPSCHVQEGAKPPLPRNAKLWPGRVLRPKRGLGTLSSQAGERSRAAPGEQPGQTWCRCALLCTFGDEMRYCCPRRQHSFQTFLYVRVIFVSPVACPCSTQLSLWDLSDCHIMLSAFILHGRKSCLEQNRTRSNGGKYSKEGGKKGLLPVCCSWE